MKGTYTLIINVKRSMEINVGRMGPFLFKRGIYLYVGSAMGFGSSSLESRIERHYKKQKNAFWHIDYLLMNHDVKLTYVIFSRSTTNLECRIADSIKNQLNVLIPVEKYGSSDCKCSAHFLKVKSNYVYKDLLRNLKGIYSELGLCPKLIKF